MVKKVNKVQNNTQNNVQNQQVNNNDCQHVQLGGMAYYDAKQYFLFSPQESGVIRFLDSVRWAWLSKCLTEHLISWFSTASELSRN